MYSEAEEREKKIIQVSGHHLANNGTYVIAKGCHDRNIISSHMLHHNTVYVSVSWDHCGLLWRPMYLGFSIMKVGECFFLLLFIALCPPAYSNHFRYLTSLLIILTFSVPDITLYISVTSQFDFSPLRLKKVTCSIAIFPLGELFHSDCVSLSSSSEIHWRCRIPNIFLPDP